MSSEELEILCKSITITIAAVLLLYALFGKMWRP